MRRPMSNQSQRIEEHRLKPAAAADDFTIRCAQAVIDLFMYGSPWLPWVCACPSRSDEKAVRVKRQPSPFPNARSPCNDPKAFLA